MCGNEDNDGAAASRTSRTYVTAPPSRSTAQHGAGRAGEQATAVTEHCRESQQAVLVDEVVFHQRVHEAGADDDDDDDDDVAFAPQPLNLWTTNLTPLLGCRLVAQTTPVGFPLFLKQQATRERRARHARSAPMNEFWHGDRPRRSLRDQGLPIHRPSVDWPTIRLFTTLVQYRQLVGQVHHRAYMIRYHSDALTQARHRSMAASHNGMVVI
jgi:hypothetical protein